MIAATSRLAFLETVSERETEEEELLSLLRGHPEGLTDREAYELLGWEAPSVVSARRNGIILRWKSAAPERRIDLPNVVELGKKKAETGKLVSVWGVNDGTLGI